MELSFFKTVGSGDAFLNRIDGRLKTVFFILCIVVSAVARHWYFALAFWIAATVSYHTLRIPWRHLFVRLAIPFAVAWLVFLSAMFTNGSHPLWVVSYRPHLVVYREGAALGLLMMLRIMAAVSTACLLSFSTPMEEILETFRSLKFPRIMIDIAELMARYVYTVEETARNMRRAQACRTVCKIPWIEKIRNLGTVAGYVMIKSFDHSLKIYNSMLSRGYSEKNMPAPYFTSDVPPSDLRKGAIMMAIPITVCLIDHLV